ncbi:MAG: hypothetical protein H0W40_18905 [Methylibium sp.]|uniref:hypothetical protein n=1 Tax=Methylibium sp. TaxID=2067992 RepID=UPI0017F56CFF|nr:hypothetical protein [Methylibium sp.]MBA3599418.1 hypothetical protein [Methylibium sp.]
MKLDLQHCRHPVTPTVEGDIIIATLTNYFETHPVDASRGAFITDHVSEMRRGGGVSLRGWLMRYAASLQRPQEDAIPQFGILALMCCAFSVAASIEDKKLAPNRAWEYASQAQFHLGLFGGAMDSFDRQQLALDILQERAAAARHAENRAMKADVFAWCDANMAGFTGSMDDAAFFIAEKLVPIRFRAVRAHMTEWKRLRSAGTT